MIEAVLLLLCVLGCVVLVAAPLPSSEMIDPRSPRARTVRGTEKRMAYTLLALSSFVFLTLYAYSRGADWHAVGYLAALMIVSIALIHPWLMVRGLLIPLGRVELAYRLSRLGGFPWIRDPSGGAVLAGALALLQRRAHHSGLADWLEGQLGEGPLRGAGVAAAGLLAASRGDETEARVLLASVEALDPELCPQAAWRVAIDWRVADAAARGEWSEVVTLGRTGLRSSRATRFIAAAATRLSGEWVDDSALLQAWLLAPRRLRNLGLLRRAMAQANVDPTEVETEVIAATHELDRHPELDPPAAGQLAANTGGPDQARAAAMHTELLRTWPGQDGPTRAASLCRVGLAWDQELDSEALRERVSERVLDLRAYHSAEELIVSMRDSIVADLAALILSLSDGLAEGSRAPSLDALREATERAGTSGVLSRAIDRARGELLAEVDETTQGLADRQQRIVEQQRNLTLVDPDAGSGCFSAIELWRAWLAVRDVYEGIARRGGMEVRRLAFPTLEKQLGRLALWVWQVHDERGFADAMFLWLLREAEALGNESSAETYRHNLAVSF